MVIIEHADDQGTRTPVRLRVSNDRIVDVVDYWFCTWMLPKAHALLADEGV